MPRSRSFSTLRLKCADCAATTSLARAASKPEVQPEEVIRDLRARDQRDRNRADSPLRPAADAVLLDSTNMTLEEAVQAAEEIVMEKSVKPSSQPPSPLAE